ncbi:hypothetical protein M406DRAFT_284211 [Cryphonectria parasitica EP155]|uniref:NACHT domain-containing protein n=1 Tax=Cryphonectria parasitica (strain ATCC 38755 / EP155) TaxID=660469 RepID=A0A9P4YAG1_CRYP1|nr:uncharacterized protein M406DRAFT_284211 [Cryphonectria parasitica EP155]KAF3769756.1 hypothetical protein M406DRAFT_284211 [Cryphonectria parasitica EP155]
MMGAPRPKVSQGLLQDFILESLQFKSMNYREQGIAQAHGSSFEWIFNESSVAGHSAAAGGMENLSFPKWLSTSELGNIYWITGKPGSGKSTLMRYLSIHANTIRYLRTWAGDSELMVAGFYFWTSGSEEQRSQTGLLRSLLYQLLSSQPSLIAKVFPEKWQKLGAMTTKDRIATTLEWTTPELIEAFRSFLDAEVEQAAKICLFVDGLDEFDGDHETIIHFFRDVAEGRHASRVKLCLSSRPWEVFERAFEYKVPNLKLQASTSQDMLRYTIDRLSQNDKVRQVMVQDPDLARHLVQTTVEKASGVFLWVRLAVRELLRRFDNDDNARVADMRDCVLSLPTDLDELFEVLVFKNQSEAQLAESSRLFRLVRAREFVADFIKDDSATSLSLWELAFARNGETDDALVLEGRSVQQETKDAVTQRCVDTRDWALRRSVGLLDVQALPRGGNAFARPRFAQDKEAPEAEEFTQHRVTYLHRTVRDWLILSADNCVWTRLESADNGQAADPFDPHLRLLRSYVLQMKHPVEEPEQHRRLDEWYPGIALALSHARYVMHDPGCLETRFINELEKTISWYWRSKGTGFNDHWARNCFGTYEERLGRKLVIPYPFLTLCTKFGLQRYVLESLDTLAELPPESHLETQSETEPDPRIDQIGQDGGQVEGTPLLHRALEFLCSRQKTIYPLSTLSLVRGLLEYSHKYPSHNLLTPLIGSPNQAFSSTLLKRKDVTPWIMALRHVRDAKRRGWIEPFETDPAGTERWTSILRCLLVTGGADRGAIIKKDQWDPEVTAAGVLGRGGLLESFGDFWVENKLVPMLTDGA